MFCPYFSFQDRQGIVRQIYRGIIFIYDDNELENGGYICSKAQCCDKIKISVDSFPGKVSNFMEWRSIVICNHKCQRSFNISSLGVYFVLFSYSWLFVRVMNLALLFSMICLHLLNPLYHLKNHGKQGKISVTVSTAAL